jgi:TatD DNase family protein
LETDGPYNAPYPMKKGSVAHMGHIPLIAKEIAELKGISLDDALKAIRENTKRLYGI